MSKHTLVKSRRKRKVAKVSKYFTFVLVGIALFLGLYLIFIKFDLLSVARVEVVGAQSFVNSTDLTELAKSRAYGKNIITFPVKDLEDSLRENFQGARSLNISKKYPQTLVITVIERVPLAILHNDLNENHYLVDEEGYVLGIVDANTTNLPKVFYAEEIAVGYFLDQKLVSVYFELLAAVDESEVQISSASVHKDFIVAYSVGSVEILLGVDKNIKESIIVLADLLKQLATEGKDARRIDMRYDKVVVSYR
jgi:cell division septal protein FtsQ